VELLMRWGRGRGHGTPAQSQDDRRTPNWNFKFYSYNLSAITTAPETSSDIGRLNLQNWLIHDAPLSANFKTLNFEIKLHFRPRCRPFESFRNGAKKIKAKIISGGRLLAYVLSKFGVVWRMLLWENGPKNFASYRMDRKNLKHP